MHKRQLKFLISVHEFKYIPPPLPQLSLLPWPCLPPLCSEPSLGNAFLTSTCFPLILWGAFTKILKNLIKMLLKHAKYQLTKEKMQVY